MKNLWNPWRMTYIQEQDQHRQGCIFEAGTDKKYEKESLLLYRDAVAVVLLNRFPYANGHLLLAPSRHIGDISGLLPEESAALFNMIRESVAILKKHKNPDGSVKCTEYLIYIPVEKAMAALDPQGTYWSKESMHSLSAVIEEVSHTCFRAMHMFKHGVPAESPNVELVGSIDKYYTMKHFQEMLPKLAEVEDIDDYCFEAKADRKINESCEFQYNIGHDLALKIVDFLESEFTDSEKSTFLRGFYRADSKRQIQHLMSELGFMVRMYPENLEEVSDFIKGLDLRGEQ